MANAKRQSITRRLTRSQKRAKMACDDNGSATTQVISNSIPSLSEGDTKVRSGTQTRSMSLRKRRSSSSRRVLVPDEAGQPECDASEIRSISRNGRSKDSGVTIAEKKPGSTFALDSLSLEVCARIAAFVLNSVPENPEKPSVTALTSSLVALSKTSEIQRAAVEQALCYTYSPQYSIRELHPILREIRYVNAVDHSGSAIISLLQRSSLKSAKIPVESIHIRPLLRSRSLSELEVSIFAFRSSELTDLVRLVSQLPNLRSLALVGNKGISCIFCDTMLEEDGWKRLGTSCPNLNTFRLHCYCSSGTYAPHLVESFAHVPNIIIAAPFVKSLLPFLRTRESVTLEGTGEEIVSFAAKIGSPVTGIRRVSHPLLGCFPFSKMEESMGDNIVQEDTAFELAKCPRLQALHIILERGAEKALPLAPTSLESLALAWGVDGQPSLWNYFGYPVSARAEPYDLTPGWLTTFTAQMHRIRHLSLFGVQIVRRDLQELLQRAGGDLEWLAISTIREAYYVSNAAGECTFSRMLWLIDTVARHNSHIRTFVFIDEHSLVDFEPGFFSRLTFKGITIAGIDARLEASLRQLHRSAPWLDMRNLVDSIQQYLADDMVQLQW